MLNYKSIHARLKYASNMGFDKIILKNDYLEAISMLKHGCLTHHHCLYLVMKITYFPALEWQVEAWHIYKEWNQVANLLTILTIKKAL